MSPISMFSGAAPLALFLAKATLLLIVAFMTTIPLRQSTAGARHLVWLAALVGVLALPLLSRIDSLRLGVLPSSLGIPSSTAPVAMVPFADAPAVPGPITAVPVIIEVTPVAVSVATPAPDVATTAPIEAFVPQMLGGETASSISNYPILTTLAVIWAAVALALLGWLVAGAIYVRRIVATARELTSPDWAMPLCEVADRLDLELPPRLVLSDRIEMAFACRALAPTIVLPASAESWSDDRRRAVLFHELAHVKRHDLLGHTLGRVACALYWFHPLVWAAAKHLRAESERACDDLVLSCGARPSEYAQHLLDMITNVRNHGTPVMALPMARKKEFEGRMLAILDPAIRRASPGRAQAAAVIATLTVLSLTVAAVAPAAERSPAPWTPGVASSAPAVAMSAPAPANAPAPASPVIVSGQTRPPEPPSTPRVETRSSVVSDTRTTLNLNTVVDQVTKFAGKEAGSALQRAGAEIAKSLGANAVVDTGRVEMLIRILNTDTDASVRKTAAWGLNDIRSADVLAALIKALKHDADASVREMAAWALAEHPGNDATTGLADAMVHDASARVRATSAWALGDLEAKTEVSSLEGAVADPDANVRETAIWAIGELGLRTAPRGIVNGLTDSDKQVRLASAWALGEIEDKSAAAAVIKAYETETETSVRVAEMRALAAMGQTSQAVVDIALKSTDPELRRRAVSMLAGADGGSWPWPWPRPRPRPSP